MSFTFNDGLVMAAATRAWDTTAQACGDAARESIGLVRYEYPRSTKRKNKRIVGSPRDKVDTGEMASKQRLEMIDEQTSDLVNDADHSFKVHEGQGDRPPQEFLKEAISSDETGSIEWRNENALVNVPEIFAEEFADELAAS